MAGTAKADAIGISTSPIPADAEYQDPLVSCFWASDQSA
jgi:hypothetical protein